MDALVVARKPFRLSSKIIFSIFALIVLMSVASALVLFRFDQTQRQLHLLNEVFTPAVKNLHLISGKWSAYHRSIEQMVGFRKWGMKREKTKLLRFNFSRMIERNVENLKKIAVHSEHQMNPSLIALLERAEQISMKDLPDVHQIFNALQSNRLQKAAQQYTVLRQRHLQFIFELQKTLQWFEHQQDLLQMNIQEDMRNAQSRLLFFILVSVLVCFGVLLYVRKTLFPIGHWIDFARHVTSHGLQGQVPFSKLDAFAPREIQMFSQELHRMVLTLGEREKTIHDQKRVLEALNASLKNQNELLSKLSAFNERILNHLNAGIVLVSTDKSIQQVNERFCELFHCRKNSILKENVNEVIVLGNVKLWDEWLSRKEKWIERRIQVLDRYFDVHIQVIPSEGHLVSFEEVTQIVLAEDKIEHLKKLGMAANLSAQVAHEVRNPLNSMLLQLEMLKDDLEALPSAMSSGCSRRVEFILEQIQILERISGKYLEIKKPELEQEEFLDVHSIVPKIAKIFEEQLTGLGIHVNLKLEAKASLVKGNMDCIFQVLVNLFKNAIEAIEERPSDLPVANKLSLIEIRTSSSSDYFFLQFFDSGAGIDQGMQTRIFEPFVTTKAFGHGLGLSVARKICIQSGGDLQLIPSEENGFFATGFEMKLPIACQNLSKGREDAESSPG